MPRLPAEDAGLWHRATRDVAPLSGRNAKLDRRRPGRAAPVPPPPSPSPACGGGPGGGKAGDAPAPALRRTPPAPLPPLDRFAGVDRATAERLKRGRRPIEARLDLHGMTQAEAHRALAGFVTASRAAGRRCVLVITGHGRIGGGVLKTAVPRWLGEPELRQHVLAITPAQPKDGADGALYLLLRRLPLPPP